MRSFPQSICHSCAGVKYTQSKNGSLFLMCTQTAVRYPRQPLSLCHAFQALDRINLAVEQVDGTTQTFPFRISAHMLLNDGLSAQQKESDFVSNTLTIKRSGRIIHVEDQGKVYFELITGEYPLFCFEKDQILPQSQLCLEGSFILNSHLQIEWTRVPKRAPLLATLDSFGKLDQLERFEKAILNAQKFTFLQ